MSRHEMVAYCNTPGCKSAFDGEFYIVMEYMSKEELLQHIKEQVCPRCGLADWKLSDRCER